MKRFILSLAAIAAVAGPMALAASDASAQRWDGDRRGERGDRWDRRDNDRWDRRDDRRDGRRGDSRWDRSRHNGYYYNNRWHYGPPPQAYYGNPYYRPGYSQWRRGAQLPSYYRSYPVHDYHRYRLRQPPRGYGWYRVGDDYLLAALATGLIFEIISGN